MYFKKFYYLIILPIEMLLIYDFFINSIVIPLIKLFFSKKFLNIELTNNYTNTDYNIKRLFFDSETIFKVKNTKYIIIFYIFNEYEAKIKRAFNFISNLIFLLEYYKNNDQIKNYLYPFLIIFIHLIYFLIFFKFYYFNYCHQCNSIYIYFFSIVWVFYVMHHIEDILNLNYLMGDIEKFKKDDFVYKYIFSNFDIITADKNGLKRINTKDYVNVKENYDEYYDKKLENLIVLVSAVIFISILTFISFYCK
jgi:hypothetical protein